MIRDSAKIALIGLLLFSMVNTSNAQEVPPSNPTAANEGVAQIAPPAAPRPQAAPNPITGALERLPDPTSRENFSSAMQIIILLTVLSLAPAILIMMTSFTRMVIVLSLLRQALGTQQLPPNQILIGLAMFMTFLVMAPTWERVNADALQPYMNGTMDQKTALSRAQEPLRDFMMKQIVKNDNHEDVLLFTEYAGQTVNDWKDVGTMQLVPAFILSELKTAFLMGFKVYLPFLIVDMVISSVLISMGMMMLPPVLISLPFKLLLFVLVDGWRLITSGLMDSFVVR